MLAPIIESPSLHERLRSTQRLGIDAVRADAAEEDGEAAE